MLPSLVAALLVTAALQAQSPDRVRAEQLARTGQTTEAMALFEQIVRTHPEDVEARLWVARLAMRLGRVAEAETTYRLVLRDHPQDVDAKIGLGSALTRGGRAGEALEILTAAERDAGENADLFAALARAYRRAGNDKRALEYFRRAKALAPSDPDVVSGYEAVARTYGHLLGVEGFDQHGAAGSHAVSGTVFGTVRVSPRLHFGGNLRTQSGDGYTDLLAGGSAIWLFPGETTIEGAAAGGSGNTALANLDASGTVIHYAGPFEVGGGVRALSFTDAKVVAVSPQFAWYWTDQWRLDARYTYSRSAFDATDQSKGDHSMAARETWQAWRRMALIGSYAYGIESFEDLTADRLRSLGANTVAAGVRIDTPSLFRITATYEYQWRSNDTHLGRFTVAVVRAIP